MSRAATVTTCASCGAGSGTADYCDRCGAMLQASEASEALVADGPAATALTCRHCTAPRSPADAFCEGCGIDFTSGELPVPVADPPAAADGTPTGWSVVIDADRAFFDANAIEVAGGLTFPEALAPREVQLGAEEIVLGRGSGTRGAVAGIDLSGDPAVSRRHAVLRREPGGSWTLIDEGSANGTWVNDASVPVAPGAQVPLDDGDCVRLGAFSMLRLRLDTGTDR